MSQLSLDDLLEKIRKGKRVSREDLPEDMLLLEECIRLHSAEYALKYNDLQTRLVEAEKELTAAIECIEQSGIDYKEATEHLKD